MMYDINVLNEYFPFIVYYGLMSLQEKWSLLAFKKHCFEVRWEKSYTLPSVLKTLLKIDFT